MKHLLRKYCEKQAKEYQAGADYLKIFEPFPESFGYARWELAQAIANFWWTMTEALQ